mmetsp:Transcript_89379/g.255211  ORF Transcript_89379/g.255211 Transcript_89379/m.255211 type:complete len:396 (+) Transcript_89379:161-1348(+)
MAVGADVEQADLAPILSEEDKRTKRREIIGFKLAGVGRSISFSTALFLAVAILRLAIKAAGCNYDDDCDKTIYGFRPTSLLGIMNTCGTFLAACLMPLFGSVIDHTPHRRELAKSAMYLFILINGAQAMVSMDTWFFVSIMQVFTNTCLLAMQTSQFAYMSEITADHENELPRIMAVARAYELIGVLVFAFLVTVVARRTGSGDDNIGDVTQRARIGQIVGTLLGGSIMIAAWHVYLGPRPALHPLQRGESVCMKGISQLGTTFVQMQRDFPLTARFLIAFAFFEAATTGLLTCSVTYLNELGLSGQDIVFFYPHVDVHGGCRRCGLATLSSAVRCQEVDYGRFGGLCPFDGRLDVRLESEGRVRFRVRVRHLLRRRAPSSTHGLCVARAWGARG